MIRPLSLMEVIGTRLFFYINGGLRKFCNNFINKKAVFEHLYSFSESILLCCLFLFIWFCLKGVPCFFLTHWNVFVFYCFCLFVCCWFFYILDVEKHTSSCTVVFALNDKVDSDKIILFKFGH